MIPICLQEFVNTKMEQVILVSFFMKIVMVMANKVGRVGIFLKDSQMEAIEMDMENTFGKVEKYTKENGQMEINMEKEKPMKLVEQFTLGLLWIISTMVMGK
jgi:hypothetical protein